MLAVVGYFVRLGLSVAIILLNAGVVLYLLSVSKGNGHAKSVAKDMCYGAVLLTAVSVLAFLVR